MGGLEELNRLTEEAMSEAEKSENWGKTVTVSPVERSLIEAQKSATQAQAATTELLNELEPTISRVDGKLDALISAIDRIDGIKDVPDEVAEAIWSAARRKTDENMGGVQEAASAAMERVDELNKKLDALDGATGDKYAASLDAARAKLGTTARRASCILIAVAVLACLIVAGAVFFGDGVKQLAASWAGAFGLPVTVAAIFVVGAVIGGFVVYRIEER